MMHQPEILTKYGPRFYIGDIVSDSAPASASPAAAGVCERVCMCVFMRMCMCVCVRAF